MKIFNRFCRSDVYQQENKFEVNIDDFKKILIDDDKFSKFRPNSIMPNVKTKKSGGISPRRRGSPHQSPRDSKLPGLKSRNTMSRGGPARPLQSQTTKHIGGGSKLK